VPGAVYFSGAAEVYGKYEQEDIVNCSSVSLGLKYSRTYDVQTKKTL